MTIYTRLLQHKIVAIMRGVKPEDVLPIANALYQGGIKAVEITLNTPGALGAITSLSVSMNEKMLVGAGTVLNATAAREAIDAGAQFIISPSVDIETIKVTKENGVVSIPGAFTATEIVTAFNAGGDLIKVFPASNPQYIKDLRGPLSHIPMMPTGGVSLDNIIAFHKAGAVAFGIGSALVNAKHEINDLYLEDLTSISRQFVASVNMF